MRLLRFMLLRMARQLVRFILLVLIIQFLAPVLVYGGNVESSASISQFSLHTKTYQNAGLLILLNENEEKEGEKEGKKSFHSEELVDFTCVASALTFSHSPTHDQQASSTPSGQQICALHCSLII
jgi:hypothetical protein